MKSKLKVHDKFLEKMEKDVKELGKHRRKKHHEKHKVRHVKHQKKKEGHEHKHPEQKVEHHEHKMENHPIHHAEHKIKPREIHHIKRHVEHLKSVHAEHKKEEVKKVENKEKPKEHHKKHKTHHPGFKKVNLPTFDLRNERDIAMDFATKVYQRFNKLVKSVVLFGSSAKQTNARGSDIDIIIILDDATIKWDQELIAWYRGELEKIIKANPYKIELHINTIKLTTWWDDLMRGDPVVINIIRDGDTLIDFGGFFEPLKFLLINGRIKATPESVYSLLQRAPMHILRSKASEIGAIEGLFWSMVDSSQAALIAVGVQPPSPEHIPAELKTSFVNSGKLKIKYVMWYRDLFMLHKKITHREITDLKGIEIDEWQNRANEFLQEMARLVNGAISE